MENQRHLCKVSDYKQFKIYGCAVQIRFEGGVALLISGPQHATEMGNRPNTSNFQMVQQYPGEWKMAE